MTHEQTQMMLDLKNLGCTIAIKNPPKHDQTFFILIATYKCKPYRITQRFGVVSKYFVDGVGVNTPNQVIKYILNTNQPTNQG